MAHFRDTYRNARFLFLDVRVGVVIFASLLHIRFWTLGIDLIVVALAFYVERIGLGFIGALRALRMSFAGKYRPAQRIEKIRRRYDIERMPLPWETMPDRSPVMLDLVVDDPKPMGGKK